MIDFVRKLLATKALPISIILLLLVFAGPDLATAGNWRVAPIKIYFNAKTRSEVVTVTNDGDRTLSLEISAMEWSQDQDGQDVYQPASDLIFFPKQLVIEPKTERVIRTGIKVPATAREKTYRLYIREVPDPQRSPENAVAIAIQFGVPVFVAPPKEELRGEITGVAMEGGQISVTVRNQGNTHFRVNKVRLQAIAASGEPLDVVEAPGWYLLAGSQRSFQAELPVELCRRADSFDILVESDRLTLSGTTDVHKAKCPAP